MSRPITTRTATLALALLATLSLAACSSGSGEGQGDGEGHAAPHRSSSAGLPKGRVEEGEKRVNVKSKATGQSCIDCHGADGNAPIDPTYPKLGGQYRDYLAHSLQMYRDGTRDHPLMSNQAKELDDQQIADVAAYFASRESQLRDLHGVH